VQATGSSATAILGPGKAWPASNRTPRRTRCGIRLSPHQRARSRSGPGSTRGWRSASTRTPTRGPTRRTGAGRHAGGM